LGPEKGPSGWKERFREKGGGKRDATKGVSGGKNWPEPCVGPNAKSVDDISPQLGEETIQIARKKGPERRRLQDGPHRIDWPKSPNQSLAGPTRPRAGAGNAPIGLRL